MKFQGQAQGDGMEKVRQMDIYSGMTADELVRMMEGCGFGARRLAEAARIYEQMLSLDYTKFFSLSGAMVPSGMRNIISNLIQQGYIDVLVSTGANLVHDILESLGPHRLGSPEADDSCLRKEGLSRIYDVYVSDEQFVQFEELLQRLLPDNGETISGTELLRYIGSELSDGILRSAYQKDVPVFCPAIADSMIGLQAWLHKQTKRLSVDPFEEIKEIVDICYSAERAGIMIIGGGVPKNFALQSMLVTPKSFDLAVQLTTDHPEAGGLSGATLSEAISWGKISDKARYVTVYGDATINFPLIVAATLTRIAKRGL
jgi:deoxyhypusine synthase